MPRHKLPTHSSRSMVSFMCILLLSQPVIVRVEMLQVTTIISEAEKLEELKENPPPSESDIKAAELVVKEKGEAVAKTSAKDDMKCAEAYARFLYQWLLDHCYHDMEFMTKFIDKTTLQRLEMVAKSKFHRVTYTEAVAILRKQRKQEI
ncbi:UNVERIFIED_CONTAM: Asparagine--tRNA ligase, cytoplasmic 1 [Sesamum calycinum]|uniref:Asparagine--tRNA ligase, cytoplasmic 1 n=1 Tax=Sesamum calycinum TaxID=2727403 RepID=A0AAW2K2F3_9LAMI